MSACTETHKDWVICEACLPTHGDLIKRTICVKCRFVMGNIVRCGKAPTHLDVIEFDRRPKCEKCTPTKKETTNATSRSRVVEVERSISGRLHNHFPVVVRNRSRREEAQPERRAAMTRVHSAYHAFQDAISSPFGVTHCWLCSTLLRNRFRPMSHRLREE